MKTILKTTLLAAAALGLANCSNYDTNAKNKASTGAIGGAVIGGIIGNNTKVGTAGGALIGGAITGLATSAARSAPPPPPRTYYPPAPVYDNGLVYNIQSSLAVLGYDPGPIDGVYGQRTADAISAYEYNNQLPVTGQPSPRVHYHMKQAGG